MPRPFRRVLTAAAIVAACSLAARADVASEDAELQYQLATLLFEETRYPEAMRAYDTAAQAADPALARRARMGKVRTALRLAEFGIARQEAERLRADSATDPETLALYGDSLWSSG